MGKLICKTCGSEMELKVWDVWGMRGYWKICWQCRKAWDENGKLEILATQKEE